MSPAFKSCATELFVGCVWVHSHSFLQRFMDVQVRRSVQEAPHIQRFGLTIDQQALDADYSLQLSGGRGWG